MPTHRAAVPDVAVIGGGPSGAWAACLLARRGARVILVDPSHPREKPCGGGVTGRALSLVAPALGQDLPAVSIRAARFIDSRRRQAAVVPLSGAPGSNALTVSSRAAFDGLLFAAACAAGAVPIAARAVAAERTTGGFSIRTADGRVHRAARVVGADGANSLIRRTLIGRPFSRQQLSIAAGFFAHGVTSEEIVIEFTTDPPGYIWSFPRPDHLAVGVCAAADSGATSAQLRDQTTAWMRSTGLGTGGRLERYAWPIPSLSAHDLANLPIAGDGWCLVGDAAGLVDPITREGIFFALQSAACVADALSGSGDVARRYHERVRADIVPELIHAARLKDGFFRPRFTRLLVEALQQSASIRDIMSALVAGTLSYRHLKRRLAGTFEVRLALRALLGGS